MEEKKEEKDSEQEQLVLEDDVYCKTFLVFLKSDNPQLHGQYISKVFLTFGIQFCMIMLLYNEMYTEASFDDPASMAVNLTRFICCKILHVLVIPEIDSALNMMRYAMNHAPNFKYLLVDQVEEDKHDYEVATIPFAVAATKLIGGFLAEIINMIVICSSPSIQDITKDFIAMIIIAEVDNILVEILNESHQLPEHFYEPIMMAKYKRVYLKDDLVDIKKIAAL